MKIDIKPTAIVVFPAELRSAAIRTRGMLRSLLSVICSCRRYTEKHLYGIIVCILSWRAARRFHVQPVVENVPDEIIRHDEVGVEVVYALVIGYRLLPFTLLGIKDGHIVVDVGLEPAPEIVDRQQREHNENRHG